MGSPSLRWPDSVEGSCRELSFTANHYKAICSQGQSEFYVKPASPRRV
jgi:hypothetical protein